MYETELQKLEQIIQKKEKEEKIEKLRKQVENFDFEIVTGNAYIREKDNLTEYIFVITPITSKVDNEVYTVLSIVNYTNTGNLKLVEYLNPISFKELRLNEKSLSEWKQITLKDYYKALDNKKEDFKQTIYDANTFYAKNIQDKIAKTDVSVYLDVIDHMTEYDLDELHESYNKIKEYKDLQNKLVKTTSRNIFGKTKDGLVVSIAGDDYLLPYNFTTIKDFKKTPLTFKLEQGIHKDTSENTVLFLTECQFSKEFDLWYKETIEDLAQIFQIQLLIHIIS